MRNPATEFPSPQSESVRSSDAVMPARGNKECNAARHVRPDLGMQDLELLSVQRRYEQGQDDEIDEEARCCLKALRSECRQFAKLIGIEPLRAKAEPRLPPRVRGPSD